jgi:hypothetical protein
MKFLSNGRKLSALYICAFLFIFFSCSDEEIYPDPTSGLTKIHDGFVLGTATKFEMWADENLFAGYNRVFFAFYDSTSGKPMQNVHIHLHPVMDMQTKSHSCPVEQPVKMSNNLFSGGIMFTMPSGDMGTWTIHLDILNELNGRSGKTSFPVHILAKSTVAIHSFKAVNENRYFISYYFPERMKVGVNILDVIVYKSSGHDFVPAEDLTIQLTPEMPSMDHGSPNNENPIHYSNGHYRGKVNFTMTGEWRLNLELTEGETDLSVKYFDVIVK